MRLRKVSVILIGVLEGNRGSYELEEACSIRHDSEGTKGFLKIIWILLWLSHSQWARFSERKHHASGARTPTTRGVFPLHSSLWGKYCKWYILTIILFVYFVKSVSKSENLSFSLTHYKISSKLCDLNLRALEVSWKGKDDMVSPPSEGWWLWFHFLVMLFSLFFTIDFGGKSQAITIDVISPIIILFLKWFKIGELRAYLQDCPVPLDKW